MTKSLNQTEAEVHLLDVFWRLSKMGPKERRVRFTQAVNTLLEEVVCGGYTLTFSETDGLRLYTPSGLILWFVSSSPEGRLCMFAVEVNQVPEGR